MLTQIRKPVVFYEAKYMPGKAFDHFRSYLEINKMKNCQESLQLPEAAYNAV